MNPKPAAGLSPNKVDDKSAVRAALGRLLRAGLNALLELEALRRRTSMFALSRPSCKSDPGSLPLAAGTQSLAKQPGRCKAYSPTAIYAAGMTDRAIPPSLRDGTDQPIFERSAGRHLGLARRPPASARSRPAVQSALDRATPQQLFGWRRDARRAMTRRRLGDRTGGSSSAFAPVIVEAAQPRTQVPIAPAQLSGSPTIEIVIGSAIIRIPPGTDAAP